jgi:Na+-transporting NADH:ubiquinone oxidoreductase subunit NqrC
MKNTTELRQELVEVFTKLKTRKIDTGAAKAMVAISNSILKSAGVEADYNKFLGQKDAIEFLKTPTAKAKTR